MPMAAPTSNVQRPLAELETAPSHPDGCETSARRAQHAGVHGSAQRGKHPPPPLQQRSQ
jgi:hypothetical protein